MLRPYTRHASSFRQRAPFPRLGQQPLREIEPLGELAHLRLERLHAALQVVDASLGGRGPAGPVRDFPPRHPAAVGVVKLAGGDYDYVVEVPDPEPAEGEAHPDAAVRA